MKRWTKKEFIAIVQPCGYRFRIWWWFLWHRYVTLLDIVNAEDLFDGAKIDVVSSLDWDYCVRVWGRRSVGELLPAMRKELENETQ